jgi:flavin reductase (DIM6/NTAB) family NADH-FMN oxidoreductase RutF
MARAAAARAALAAAPMIGAVAGGDELRTVMRRVPAGVAVVTVDAEGQRLGLTVGSLVSLSLDPPLVGVAIAVQAAMHELLRDARGFGVSLLAGDQVGLAQHFARGVPPIVLWTGIEVREGRRAPLLEGALGWVECALEREVPTGDHTFFVGAVDSAEPGRDTAPLLYLGSEYRGL